MLDIVGKRKWYFLGSGLIILVGLISLILPPGWSTFNSGLKPGIEFSSGSVLTVTFATPVSEEDVRQRLAGLGHPEALVQKSGRNLVIIRTRVLAEPTAGTISERESIQQELGRMAPIEASEFASVSPIVAQETVRNAFIALAVSAIGIFLYVWYSFHRVPKAYRYGASTILALVHDLVIVLGIFSILGKTMGMEVNSMFIVGMLTLAGYSVNDTIVVLDRIRENISRHPDQPLDQLVNLSTWETMARSLNTSLTVFFVVLAMLLMGGASIRELLLVLTFGVVVGSYSSIFIASQFLVIWERGEIGRFFGRGRRASVAAATMLLHLVAR
ncbi:MAG: protein translocase subunit SecF [Dehalococcoidia bacterium]|nr:protein translocase subunit SecF [Dehalococcoidia bacterium]MSQ16697.1 protein translocase subunit SecF [Dehalococcoidia bacterium]